MKIASFNVNGITARLPNLLRWLAESRPDVACLQELKVPHDKFPEAALREAGYGVIWHGQKSLNGVAILARGADPLEVRRVLPGNPDDLHSRYIEGQAGGVLVGCLYLPNGNPAPGPKFDYKLQWLKRFEQHAETLLALNSPVVLAGDYNVIPTEFDVFGPERWVDDALFRPESRDAFAGLLARGWTDALRSASRGAHLHLLGLLSKSLRARSWAAHRSFCCSVPRLRRGSSALASIARFAAGRRRAITPRPGFKSPTDLP
jgi:exodeoxyribonuclease-3